MRKSIDYMKSLLRIYLFARSPIQKPTCFFCCFFLLNDVFLTESPNLKVVHDVLLVLNNFWLLNVYYRSTSQIPQTLKRKVTFWDRRMFGDANLLIFSQKVKFKIDPAFQW